MKPNFALTLSSEGLRLLQRAPAGWLLVGEVGFDDDDLSAAVTALIEDAGRIDPTPLRTKLVIPNEQIKYMTVASTAKTEAEAEDDAAFALRGATPYELHELRFDWAMDDGQLYIAAVARETLAEAESFAQEHGFNPVTFVALPEQSNFAGEPFFGLTKAAQTLLDNTDNVMRDLQPIRVIGLADIPAPEPDPVPKPELQPEPAPLPDPKAPDAPAQLGPETSADAPDTEPSRDEEETLSQEIEDAAVPVSFASVRKADPVPDAPTTPPKTPEPERKLTLLATPETKTADTPTPPAETGKTTPVAPPPPAPPLGDFVAATSPLPKPKTPRARALPLPAEVGGKPRHLGLILTAILLIFLAVMAVMASYMTPGGLTGLFGDPEEIQVAEPLPLTEATEEEMAEAADVETAGNVTEGENAPPPSEAMLLPDLPRTLSPQEAEAQYIATGIWQIAPTQPQAPPSQGESNVYLASIDPRVQAVDAVALPDAGLQHDLPPSERLNPAAAGTDYDLDTRGLVKATPEGALTPDGIRIFSGRPEVLPPPTPTRFRDTPTGAGGATAEIRPRARPQDLQESNEREQLGGLTRTELAALRPRARPETIVAAVEAAVEAVQQEEEAAQDDGLIQSIKPRARPSGFSRIVQNTEQYQGVDSASAATRTASAAPIIPSTASVARQATVKNALNLRQVNLIGVYGKSSDRRALVRMSNGRYKKVKVGDRIDGGKVATITETELRYVKNGRNVVLKMPRG